MREKKSHSILVSDPKLAMNLNLRENVIFLNTPNQRLKVLKFLHHFCPDFDCLSLEAHQSLLVYWSFINDQQHFS